MKAAHAFLRELHRLAEADGESGRTAVDFVIRRFFEYRRSDAATLIDEILRKSAADRLPDLARVAMLQMCRAWKDRLPCRELFYRETVKALGRTRPPEKVAALLGGLE